MSKSMHALLSVIDVLQVACMLHSRHSIVCSWQGTMQKQLEIIDAHRNAPAVLALFFANFIWI